MKKALLLLAAVCSPLVAQADTYPAQSGYIFVDDSGPFATSKAAVCSSFQALVSGDVHYDDDGGDVWQHCGGTSYPLQGSGAFVGEVTAAKCHQANVGCHWYRAALACPNGGSLWENLCVSAPSCPTGQRDPVTGKCGLIKQNKALGPCVECTLSIANPANAGTGTNYQVENVYGGRAKTGLVAVDKDLSQCNFLAPRTFPDIRWDPNSLGTRG